jgi:hypothetical protein
MTIRSLSNLTDFDRSSLCCDIPQFPCGELSPDNLQSSMPYWTGQNTMSWSPGDQWLLIATWKVSSSLRCGSPSMPNSHGWAPAKSFFHRTCPDRPTSVWAVADAIAIDGDASHPQIMSFSSWISFKVSNCTRRRDCTLESVWWGAPFLSARRPKRERSRRPHEEQKWPYSTVLTSPTQRLPRVPWHSDTPGIEVALSENSPQCLHSFSGTSPDLVPSKLYGDGGAMMGKRGMKLVR